MTVYVDDAIHPWRGRKWAHLFSEDLDALHAFAARLGLKRAWFQQPPKTSWPHYDVTDTKRLQALRLGAVAADRCTTLEIGLRFQGRLSPEWQSRIADIRARNRQETLL